MGDQIKDKMGGKPVACVGERRGSYRAFGGKHEGKRPLGRPSHRLEENIKMSLQEISLGGGEWTRIIWLKLGTGGRLL
jgi:hypothetical protein